ncbi:MAG: ABC transporter substrate-binding protein [Firmicutes bacterium]|nr:ABC transporter substrate-binding protein [Alicyclobacillaceae bacterium]MCL6496303.1 ABC transporter substrate-binding protein [Bacillota bacterium]
MMLRPWALCASAWVGLMALAGCGAAGAAAHPKAAPGSQPITLTYDYPVGVSGPLAQIMNGMVARFNQTHPGIHVDPVFSGNYPETLAKVETAIQSGTPPAVAVLNHTAVFDLLHLNAVVPLDGLVRAGDFYPALLEPKVGGHYWSVPFQRSTVVLYYNEALFQKAGLNPHQGPATWQQLVQDAKTIEAKTGVTGIEIPSDGTVYWEFQPFAIEAGQNLASNNGRTVYFNAPAAKRALQFWMDLSHRYHVEPPGILPWNTVPDDFEQGKTAMIVHSSGSLAAIVKNSPFPVGVAFMPHGVGSARTNMGGGDFYIFRGLSPATTAAAMTFVRWMTAPAQAAYWSMHTGYVPVTPRALQQPAMQRFLRQHPEFMVAPDQLQYAEPELSTYQLNQIYDIFDSAVQSVLDGQKNVNAALDQAQQQAESVLAPYQRSQP